MLADILARHEEQVRMKIEGVLISEFAELRQALKRIEASHTGALTNSRHQGSLAPQEPLSAKSKEDAEGSRSRIPSLAYQSKAGLLAQDGTSRKVKEDEEENPAEEEEESEVWEEEETCCMNLRQDPEDVAGKFKQMYGIHISTLCWPLLAAVSWMGAFVYVLCTRREHSHKVLAANLDQTCLQVGRMAFAGASVLACRSKVLASLFVYQARKENYSARLTCIARSFLIPFVGPIYGLGGAFWVIARFTVYAEVPGGIAEPVSPLMDAFRPMWYYSSWLCMAGFFILVLRPPWAASRFAVQNIIDKMNSGSVDDWDEMTDEVNSLDETLENLWTLSEAALPWLISLVLAGLSVISSVIQYLRADSARFKYSLFFSSLELVILLYALSLITSACTNTRANADSIPAAAQRAFSRALPAMPAEQRHAHARFMEFCRGYTMGVEIQGVLIDWNLVMRLFVTLFTILPTACGILEKLMQDMPAAQAPTSTG